MFMNLCRRIIGVQEHIYISWTLSLNRKRLGLGQYGKQPIQYVFDTDLADTIRIRYDTHVHDLRFQNQEFWISTT